MRNRNISKLANVFLTKTADYSNYNQILNLKAALTELKNVVNDDNNKGLVSGLLHRASTLAHMIYNYGITTSVSNKYKTEMLEKLNEVKAGKNLLSNVKRAFDNFIPSNINSIKTADFTPAQPQEPHLAPKFEFPKSQQELESWPAGSEKKEDGSIEVPTTEIQVEAPKKEVPKFNLHPKPGENGYIPGSEKPTFDVDPIMTTSSAIKYLKAKINNRKPV